MTDQYEDFDTQHYIKQKCLRILKQNHGVKLTTETLDTLAQAGLRPIPPETPKWIIRTTSTKKTQR